MGRIWRGALGRYSGSLDLILRSAIVPYGYTVTTWAAGAVLINEQGTPNVGQAFLFVSGALLGFALLAAVSHRRAGERLGTARSPLAAGLHVLAVGGALGVASLADRIPDNVAWILSSFTVTTLYLGLASLELALSEEVAERRGRRRVADAGRPPEGREPLRP